MCSFLYFIFFFCPTERPTFTRGRAMGNEPCYWDGLIIVYNVSRYIVWKRNSVTSNCLCCFVVYLRFGDVWSRPYHKAILAIKVLFSLFSSRIIQVGFHHAPELSTILPTVVNDRHIPIHTKSYISAVYATVERVEVLYAGFQTFSE